MVVEDEREDDEVGDEEGEGEEVVGGETAVQQEKRLVRRTAVEVIVERLALLKSHYCGGVLHGRERPSAARQFPFQ